MVLLTMMANIQATVTTQVMTIMTAAMTRVMEDTIVLISIIGGGLIQATVDVAPMVAMVVGTEAMDQV